MAFYRLVTSRVSRIFCSKVANTISVSNVFYHLNITQENKQINLSLLGNFYLYFKVDSDSEFISDVVPTSSKRKRRIIAYQGWSNFSRVSFDARLNYFNKNKRVD